MQDNATFVQVGIVALRAPGTGEFLPAVPLYVKAENGEVPAEAAGLEDFAKLLAKKFKAYKDGCKQAEIQGA